MSRFLVPMTFLVAAQTAQAVTMPPEECYIYDDTEQITFTKAPGASWSNNYLRFHSTVVVAGREVAISSPCTTNGINIYCVTLGTAPVESLGSNQYQIDLQDFPGLASSSVVGVEATSGFTVEEVKTTWGGGCEMEPGPDESSCNQLASECGYQECNAANAIGGLFGGCAGLMCHCQLSDGSWVEDAITMTELNGGGPECDRSTDVPVNNPAPPATQTAGG